MPPTNAQDLLARLRTDEADDPKTRAGLLDQLEKHIRPQDTCALTRIAAAMGEDDWNADLWDEVARLVGKVRPHPGAEHTDSYRFRLNVWEVQHGLAERLNFAKKLADSLDEEFSGLGEAYLTISNRGGVKPTTFAQWKANVRDGNEWAPGLGPYEDLIGLLGSTLFDEEGANTNTEALAAACQDANLPLMAAILKDAAAHYGASDDGDDLTAARVTACYTEHVAPFLDALQLELNS